MHIKTPQSALLSNHEVLLHLEAEEAEYTGRDGTGRKRQKPRGLEHVLRDTLDYLHRPEYACTTLTSAHPTRPITLYKGPHSLLRALAPKYRLNKAEYLQLYNIRPRTRVALDLIIEEAGTRFSDTELDDILGVINAVFDEEEGGIPAGVEEQVMEKLPEKLLGASKKRKGRRKE